MAPAASSSPFHPATSSPSRPPVTSAPSSSSPSSSSASVAEITNLAKSVETAAARKQQQQQQQFAPSKKATPADMDRLFGDLDALAQKKKAEQQQKQQQQQQQQNTDVTASARPRVSKQVSSKSLIPEKATFRDNMDAVADHIKEVAEASRNELQVCGHLCFICFFGLCCPSRFVCGKSLIFCTLCCD